MANVLSVTYFVIGMVVMQTCLFVWTSLMVPQIVERSSRRLQTSPWACFTVGFLFTLMTSLILGGLLCWRLVAIGQVASAFDWFSEHLTISRVPHDALVFTHAVGSMFAGPWMASLVIGGAAFSRLFAGRAAEYLRWERRLPALVTGAFCTSASCFLPFIGWFVFVPIVGCMAVGAGILGMWRREPATTSNGYAGVHTARATQVA